MLASTDLVSRIEDNRFKSNLVYEAGNAAIAQYEVKRRRKAGHYERNNVRKAVAVAVYQGETNFDNLVSTGVEH